MVTIKTLEVTLELEGDEREQDFTRLFNQHMERWQRHYAEEAVLQRLADFERGLGDRGGAGEP
ncbi:putative phage tail protein [Haliangium sp.]|uniref:putative phage tail protein n=1 Tax=Haliangium sp. TaxID=2663208 RepID=UPI003D0A54D7